MTPNFNFGQQPTMFDTPSSSFDLGGSGSWGGASSASDLDPSSFGMTAQNSQGLGDLMGGQSMFDRLGLGMNVGTLNMGLDGLKSIAGLYMGMKQLGLAKKQLGFMRNSANANLANSTQSYNTTLADREKARGVVEGLTPDQVNAYVAQNSLKPRTV
jgi:hypothetical protein